MFIWMILAVFMAALFSFTLNPREDHYDVVNVPRAEGVAANLMTMHSAATQYVFDHKDPVATYNSGVLSQATMSSYLPVGYKNSNNVVSEIFCFDMTNSDTRVQIGCSNTDAMNFVISYVETPRRFTTIGDDGEVRASRAMDLALAKVGSNAITIGYTVKATAAIAGPIGSLMAIQSYRGAFVYIPQGAQSIDGNGGNIGYNYLVYITSLTNSSSDLPAPI